MCEFDSRRRHHQHFCEYHFFAFFIEKTGGGSPLFLCPIPAYPALFCPVLLRKNRGTDFQQSHPATGQEGQEKQQRCLANLGGESADYCQESIRRRAELFIGSTSHTGQGQVGIIHDRRQDGFYCFPACRRKL